MKTTFLALRFSYCLWFLKIKIKKLPNNPPNTIRPFPTFTTRKYGPQSPSFFFHLCAMSFCTLFYGENVQRKHLSRIYTALTRRTFGLFIYFLSFVLGDEESGHISSSKIYPWVLVITLLICSFENS